MLLDDISASQLLESVPEPMLVMSSDGFIVSANDALAHLLETDAPPLATTVTQFLPETERARLTPLTWMRRWAETPEAPEREHVHLICRTARGNDRPVRVRVGRLSIDDVYYLVLLHDITQEQTRQRQSRQAHRLAARILANSADAIVNVNAEFTIIYANPSAETLFGYGSGELVDKPLMLHVGNAPPVIDDVLDLLRPGDIVTHTYHGKTGGVLGHGGRVIDAFREAVARGVIVDLGHGRSSFSFRVCQAALDQGMPLHTISSDLHRGNVERYAVSLARTMSKVRMLGFSLIEVVQKVTREPARAIAIEQAGFGRIEGAGPTSLTV
ncbi:MAG: PAS domain S-box protein, partial [Proteobacteria bacterium]|nr:PAS domain S-box protein [Pseudomonadota bacterium]